MGDVTRFLWLEDIRKEIIPENIVIYRFKRVPFGIISSPFLLSAVIRYLLNSETSVISGKVARNIHVDNVMLSAENVKEGIKKADEAKDLTIMSCHSIMEDASAKHINYNTSVSSKTSPRFRRRFNTGNRDGGIRKKRRVKGIIFRYVKTADNPANLASRGALTKVLKDSLLWWNGPSWMDSPTKKMDKGRSWRRS
uniref:Reverse transcriptase domain-containing protein n=1 Tax=Onchocerca volvulus TaxID=6282 RepID=A0A8R1U1B1_ONCVO